MFGLFKKKSAKEKLQEEYQKLMKQAYEASHKNRALADKLTAEAELIANKIKDLQ